MKILVKEPQKKPVIIDFEGKYRTDVEKLIGDGNCTMEFVHIVRNEVDMIVDEDGLPKELPFNFFINHMYPIQAIVGTVVFCRYQWENSDEKEIYDYELRDLTEQDIEYILTLIGVDELVSFEAEQYKKIETANTEEPIQGSSQAKMERSNA